MSHTTVWETNGVYWKLDGELTSTELFEFNQELLTGSAIDQMKYFIVDCLGVTTYRDDSDDAKLTAIQSNELTRYNQQMIGVFVYDTPLMEELIKGYIATMEALGAPWDLVSMDTLEDARNWIEATT